MADGLFGLGLKGMDLMPCYAWVETGKFFMGRSEEENSFSRIENMPDIEGRPYLSDIRRAGFGLYWIFMNAAVPAMGLMSIGVKTVEYIMK